MLKRGTKEVDASFQLMMGGRKHLIDEVAMPFLTEVSEALKGVGLEEGEAGFDVSAEILPASGPSRPRMAVEPATALIIGVSVFLGTAIGSWAVSKVCDAVLDHAVKPALKRLRARMRRNKKIITPSSPLRMRIGVWYDVDRLYVLVIAEVTASAELAKVESLVPRAHDLALDWVKTHGITGQTLTYRVRHGELGRYPCISRSTPER